MVECSICHKHIDEKVALVNTDKDAINVLFAKSVLNKKQA